MRSVLRKGLFVSALVLLGCSGFAAIQPAPAAATACPSGSVLNDPSVILAYGVTGCSLDDKTISGGRGVGTFIFPGATDVTVAPDTSTPFNPGLTLTPTPSITYRSTTLVTSAGSFNVSVNSGGGLIDDITASLIGASLSGSGASLSVTVSTPGGPFTLDPSHPTITMTFSPVSSLSEQLSGSIQGNGEAGGAIIQGFSIHFSEAPPSPIPEPPSLVLLGTSLVGLAALRHRISWRTKWPVSAIMRKP